MHWSKGGARGPKESREMAAIKSDNAALVNAALPLMSRGSNTYASTKHLALPLLRFGSTTYRLPLVQQRRLHAGIARVMARLCLCKCAFLQLALPHGISEVPNP